MKQELKKAIENMKKYNSGVMYNEVFGFPPDIFYDALIVAPGWKPTKIIKDPTFKITELRQHAYLSGFLVEKDNLKIAWAQTASGGCNLLDNLIICSEMKFKKCIFIGAVGGLSNNFEIGDFCTPVECISGVYASHYFDKELTGFSPFDKIYPDINFVEKIIKLSKENNYSLKTAKVFCTDSIALEYSHLDEIRATGAELIEMETSTFYTVTALMEIPSIALLVVSDNSTTGVPLIGREGYYQERYHQTRCQIIPDMIYKICNY